MVGGNHHRPVLRNLPQQAGEVLVHVQHFVAVFIRYRTPFVANLVRSGKVCSDDIVAVRGKPLLENISGGLVTLIIIGMTLEGVDEFNLIMTAIHVAHNITSNHTHGVMIGIGGEQPWVGAAGMAHVEISEAVNRGVWNSRHHLSNAGC